MICVFRLSRLLYKHKFEEAEKFALQFGLDVEVSLFVEMCIKILNSKLVSKGWKDIWAVCIWVSCVQT